MTAAWWAEQCSLCAAAVAITARSVRHPLLRPLAVCLASLAALDLARLASPPRWLDVALCAAWWPVLALAVALGLCSGDRDHKC